MNAALTRLTDGATKKKTAKYLTKAQAKAVVIKFASLYNTATILRRVVNAVDQQEHVTFLKRLFFIFPRVRFSGSLSTLHTPCCRSPLQVSFQAMNEHETKTRPYMVCVLTMGSWLHPF